MANRRRYRGKAIKQNRRLNSPGSPFHGKLIGCTETCAAVGIDTATLGGRISTEYEVRSESGEMPPDPRSPGLNLGQIDRAMARLHIEFHNRSTEPWSALLAELDHNAAVLVQLAYEYVGGGNIGHAFLLHKLVGGKIEAMDPILGKWSWYDADDILRAMREFRDDVGVDRGLLWGAFRRAQWISTDQQPQVQP